MDLQNALLLIGAIVIAAVAISTYDKVRLSRRREHRNTRTKQKSDRARDRSRSARPRLDINPRLPTDLDKKSLKSDDSVSESTTTRDSPIYRELERLERAAVMPLNLGTAVNHVEGLFPVGQNHGPNPKIDFIVHLPGRGPVMRDSALGVYKQNEYVLEKPRQLYGLHYLVGRWSPLERDGEDAQYSDLALTIQMADSNGPIEESELNAFLQVALKLADALNRRTRLAMTVEQALERGRELQQFAEKYDVIASVNVVAKNGSRFSGREIEGAAQQLGMQLGAMNIFHMKNERSGSCRHLFSMANLYQPGEFDPTTFDTFHTEGLTLFMTIPCVHEPARVFEKMAHTANGLCEMLDGRLIDQDKRPLTEEGLSVIRRQIRQLATDMSAEGVVPGSETALRFFNP